MNNANQLDLSQAREYRKKATVLAFHNTDGATYHKSWGDQHLPDEHYVIIGPGNDIYGCAVAEFEAMYEAVSDLENGYRKKVTVRALQADAPFRISTVTSDGNLEAEAIEGRPGDWIVEQVKGERQRIEERKFAELYEPVHP